MAQRWKPWGARFTLRSLLLTVAFAAICLGIFVDWRQTRYDFVMYTLGGSSAMEPYISGRAILVTDRNAFQQSIPKRWETVVFGIKETSTPGQVATGKVLRVIGMPGETVSFADGHVVIDGKSLKRPAYLPSHLQDLVYRNDLDEDSQRVSHPYTVPDGSYYLLGDNPTESTDSRMFGAIPRTEIVGRYPTMGKPEESMWPKIALAAIVMCILLWLLSKSRESNDESTELESVKRE